MSQLNLKHLRYFWMVASHGGVTRASELLHLTPQTISGQLKELEEQVGDKLFEKSGRQLALTETGRIVFSYADEMFRIGNELEDVLSGHTPGSNMTLYVGIAMVLPKLLAYKILEPVLNIDMQVRLVCHEAPLDDLLADLSIHKLDVVLADCPVNPTLNIRAYNHLLGESETSFFVATKLARRYSKNFPQSLNGAPFLLPSTSTFSRKSIEYWFEQNDIHPQIIAEFEDRALMKTFGEASAGIFAAPTIVEDEILTKYGVKVIGRSSDITERYYAISSERRIKQPAVSAITEAARSELFI